MSHFTVMVIGDNVEEQLAPFNEQTEDKKYLEFNDEEDEYLEKYNNEASTRVVMPDGRLLYPWDDVFRVKGTFGQGSDTHKVPENLEQREVPFKELYKTFEEFMSDYCGSKSRDEQKGRYGYWSNPNAKWDWYSLGGRWTGFFKLNKGSVGEVGRPGIMTKESEDGYADSARICNIDIKGMRDEAAERARKGYELVETICGGSIPKIERSWEAFLKDESFSDHNARRKAYHAQDALRILKEGKEKHPELSKKLDFFLEDYQCTKEEYMDAARRRAIQTFAVLKDGKWYERGEMGWWGCVSNDKGEDEWEKQFASLLETLPRDTRLSIVDCHI